ncbi:hypothetical protein RFI_23932, partial [Reticulomyxa filosa]
MSQEIAKIVPEEEKKDETNVEKNVEKVETKAQDKPLAPEKTTGGLHFRELVPALHKSLSQGDYHEKAIMSEVQSLMERYDEKFGDWQRFALMEEEEGKYSRNLITRNKYFTLIPIHDHGGSECWLRVVQGTLEERFYEKPQDSGPLVRKFVTEHKSPAVCFINGTIFFFFDFYV